MLPALHQQDGEQHDEHDWRDREQPQTQQQRGEHGRGDEGERRAAPSARQPQTAACTRIAMAPKSARRRYY